MFLKPASEWTAAVTMSVAMKGTLSLLHVFVFATATVTAAQYAKMQTYITPDCSGLAEQAGWYIPTSSSGACSQYRDSRFNSVRASSTGIALFGSRDEKEKSIPITDCTGSATLDFTKVDSCLQTTDMTTKGAAVASAKVLSFNTSLPAQGAGAYFVEAKYMGESPDTKGCRSPTAHQFYWATGTCYQDSTSNFKYSCNTKSAEQQ